MRLGHLIREALASARSAPVPSALVLFVVAAMCCASVLTVGRQAAAEDALAEVLAGPQARTLTVTDTRGGVLTGPTVTLLTGLSGTEAVVAREQPVDAVNGVLGLGAQPVAVVALHGRIETVLDLREGRWPGPGEAIVPIALLATLRLAAPAGYLETSDGSQWQIVGSFTARAPFEDLNAVVVWLPESTSTTQISQVHLVAESPEQASAMRNSALAIIAADSSALQLSGPTAASASAETITGQLTDFGRSLLLLILGAGAFLVAVVVLADVLIRRRDLGRRRTLGITRGDLIALVTLRTTVSATLGAGLGSAAGYLWAARLDGAVPVDFTVAVAVLGALTAAAACLPPAAFAAARDPVEVMRTP